MHVAIPKRPLTFGPRALIANHTYSPPPIRHAATGRKTLLRGCHGLFCLDHQQSEAASRMQRSHARARPDHPPQDRPVPHRAVPLHHLSQDHRGHIPTPDQDQHPWRRLARIRHQPLDRRSRRLAGETRIRSGLIKSSPSSPIAPDSTIEQKRSAILQICPASCWDDARQNEDSGWSGIAARELERNRSCSDQVC
jgi:hypothetical protein